MKTILQPTRRGWCKPRTGAKYRECSYKKFLTYFKKGLRHIKLPSGRILTKYDWIDEYFEQFEVRDSAKEMAQELAEELVEGMT